jgi:hypothetical protein
MGDGRGGGRAALCAALLVIAGTPAARGEGGSCEPWPGEPVPLPTVAARDPALARWAELRVVELVARAQLAESGDVLESHRLWRRVLCLDPTSHPAWRGLDRTRPVRVYRPELRWGEAPQRSAGGDPWDGLAAPVLVARTPPPPRPVAPEAEPRRRPPRPAPAPTPAVDEAALARQRAAEQQALARQRAAEEQQALARKRAAEERELARKRAAQEQALARSAARERAEDLLRQGDERLRSARFEEALDRATAARQALAGLPVQADLQPVLVRAEVLAATAQVALGDDAGARESFTRALAADPALSLDPMKTSPKVMKVLEAARSGGSGR